MSGNKGLCLSHITIKNIPFKLSQVMSSYCFQGHMVFSFLLFSYSGAAVVNVVPQFCMY